MITANNKSFYDIQWWQVAGKDKSMNENKTNNDNYTTLNNSAEGKREEERGEREYFNNLLENSSEFHRQCIRLLLQQAVAFLRSSEPCTHQRECPVT